MSFEDDFRATAAGDLAAALGEPVLYTPAGGTARTIDVIVKRPPASTVAPTSHAAPQLELFIPRSDDTAVGLPSIDVGGDTVTLADYPGRAARVCRVVQILSTVGGWTLRLR